VPESKIIKKYRSDDVLNRQFKKNTNLIGCIKGEKQILKKKIWILIH
jgi:hypothetical protein